MTSNWLSEWLFGRGGGGPARPDRNQAEGQHHPHNPLNYPVQNDRRPDSINRDDQDFADNLSYHRLRPDEGHSPHRPRRVHYNGRRDLPGTYPDSQSSDYRHGHSSDEDLDSLALFGSSRSTSSHLPSTISTGWSHKGNSDVGLTPTTSDDGSVPFNNIVPVSRAHRGGRYIVQYRPSSAHPHTAGREIGSRLFYPELEASEVPAVLLGPVELSAAERQPAHWRSQPQEPSPEPPINFDLTPPPLPTPRVYELPANPYIPGHCNPLPPPIVPPRPTQRGPIPQPADLSWESLSSDEKPEADLALGFKIWSQGSRGKLEKQLKKGCKNEKVKEVLDILKNSASKFKQHSSLFESPILECLKAPSDKRNKCLLGLVSAMQEEGHKLKSIGKSTGDNVLTKLLCIRRTSTFQQQINALNFLLKQGARSLVKKRDAQGCSPLDYAVLSGNAGAVALLLQYQADPMSQNRSQKSARDIAMESASRLTQGGSELMINNHAHIMNLLFRDGQPCTRARAD
ncbi:hypothetical protein CGCS363_v010488 [Colletotrichum siamense]|uniref:uncharacterized protein n=1 Tax=Colletotrichum siamense TaxID=690259 RepID=UPI00187232A7|nr:uncharacterized protein CGCS363_v010488 [Colletotrichum siamense]KAF5492467.1 hypothetical protein CGCS363_v010488 [Colletotrichum siamense]